MSTCQRAAFFLQTIDWQQFAVVHKLSYVGEGMKTIFKRGHAHLHGFGNLQRNCLQGAMQSNSYRKDIERERESRLSATSSSTVITLS